MFILRVGASLLMYYGIKLVLLSVSGWGGASFCMLLHVG